MVLNTESSDALAGKTGPVWRRIADQIYEDISAGRLHPGAKLPTESALAKRFGVNRHTVRRALSELSSDGFVQATQGRGTFVTDRPIQYPIASRTRFSEIISSQALQPGGRLIASASLSADAVVAERLRVEVGTALTQLEVLRVAQGQPITVATLWFVAALVPNLIADYAETGSISEALTRAGFRDYRREQSLISTAIVDAHDKAYLKLSAGAPVLIVESVNVSANGVPLQFARSRFSGEAVQLAIES